MAETAPLKLSNKAQLFIDDRFVESMTGAELTANRPEFEGVAVRPGSLGAWDDAWVGGYGQVMEVAGVYRMYTICRSVDHIHRLLAGEKPPTPLGYAESDDGIHWRKPSLGLWEYGGSKDNNISCMDGGYVFVDPNADKEERYKLLVFAHHFIGATVIPDCLDKDQGGFYILTSPDGLRWNWNGNRVFPFQADTLNQVDWDPRIGRYVAYIRTWPNGFIRGRRRAYGRGVGRLELDDPMRPWPYQDIPDPFYTLTPDDIATITGEVPTVLTFPGYDQPGNWTDVYTPAVFRYPWAEDVYFSFPALNHHNETSKPRNRSTLEVGMAVSRDGIHWQWPSPEPYIPLAEPGTGRSASIYGLYGMLLVDGKLYQYHHGCDIEHGMLRGSDPDDWPGSGAVYRTTQRQDGFVSVDFQADGGQLTTTLIHAPGDRLHLNVNAGAGEGRAGILDEQGHFLPGLNIEACDPFSCDCLDHTVTWQGSPQMPDVQDRPIRIVFRMHRAKLFSFRIT
ncbi:MAG: hypothetical protein QGI83_12745 [Candidatus Latescibacteria bacterium]|jgi:hypothetical protein|nr:hypothetical protein [Candidatus Latescibacterota bacterium]